MDHYLHVAATSRHLDARRRADALTRGTRPPLPAARRVAGPSVLRSAVGRALVAAGTRLQHPAGELRTGLAR